jgi:hypothetical protein
MRGYVGYGLRICSAVELSSLLTTSVTQDDADVIIREGEVHLGDAPRSQGTGWLHGDAQEMVLYHEGLAFRISNGREIVVDAPGEEHSWMLHVLLTGPVMAVLIHQRGVLPLHASAVAIDGKVCAFLGESGWGKSTLAAALNRRGHPIVADDVVGIGFQADGRPVVHPAFAQLRIAPGAAAALGIPLESLPPLDDDADGRVLYAASNRATLGHAIPLDSLFVLAVGEAHRVDRVHGCEAFRAIERQAYVNRDLLESTGTTRRHFQQCAQLTQVVEAYRLQRPRSLSALPKTAQTVEQTCARSQRRSEPALREATVRSAEW